MKVRVFGTWSGKKIILVLLVFIVLPVLAAGGGRFLKKQANTVKQNVYFQDKNLGGMDINEARAVLKVAATVLGKEPVSAVIDSENGGVIPDLNGWALNVEKTLHNIMKAGKGEVVEPVMEAIPAPVTLADFPEKAIYRGNPLKRQVTFLINVAWGNEYLPGMLNVLKEEKAGATFFLVGRWVRQNPDLAAEITRLGFEVANHGDSDAVGMGSLDIDSAREQVHKCAQTILDTLGVTTKYFSPHRGELSDAVLKAAALENHRVIMWTVDTVDWMLPGVEAMVNKVSDKAAGGSLILMHPTEQGEEFLRRIIPILREKGLEPVSLSELLSPNNQYRGNPQ